MHRPKRLILAVPVAASSTLAALEQEADEVVCLEPRSELTAIGYYLRGPGPRWREKNGNLRIE